jgi:hypothetical protein
VALKAKLESLDGVGEAERKHYVERDGAFYLDVPDAEDVFAAGLKRTNLKLLAERKSLVDKVKGYEDLGADIPTLKSLVEAANDPLNGLDPTKTQAEIRTQVETRVKQMADGHAKEKEKLLGALSKKDQALFRFLAETKAMEAIGKHNGVPELLKPHVVSALKVVENGESYDVQVIGPDGNPRYDAASGGLLTVDALVAEMAGRDAFKPAFRAPPASGTGGNNQQRQGTGGARTIAGNDIQAFHENLKEIAAGKVTVVTE